MTPHSGQSNPGQPRPDQRGDSARPQSGAAREARDTPSIKLPTGGGAIRSIGEKFAANPVTGVGTMTIPIETSPGRGGFGPGLSLSYGSGAGNGVFGMGWQLALPAISRKTEKGLPLYQDAIESDVFILSDAEDLVPELEKDASNGWVRQDGNYVVRESARSENGREYTVRRYRPRIEGLFARIERWTNNADPSDVHWRSISRDNILTLYGGAADSRIADPQDPRRVFSWLICESRDDKGNAVLYQYKAEDGTGVERHRAHERNRGSPDDSRRTANRYLKRVLYGNRTPLLNADGTRPVFLTAEQAQGAGWMFEVVLDYGEHHSTAPRPGDAGSWSYRVDPFSTYRTGFEVRTTRLCRRILMFHHFDGAEGVGADCLVRSIDIAYSDEQDPAATNSPVYTFLRTVTRTGYVRDGDAYRARRMPPAEFEYTQPLVQAVIEDVDSLEHLPVGVDGSSYQWTDLHAEGVAGVLSEHGDAWYYKRNLSPMRDGDAAFAPLERVGARPSAALKEGARLMDLAGDGQPDLVLLAGPTPGLYEHDDEEGWAPFRAFTDRLHRDAADPNLRFADLDGDGHADVLVTEGDTLVWHPSIGESGFGPALRVALAADENEGPRLVFADGTQSIHLADMSGDGLADLVRIRNGEVCYWPNLGYGRFGPKVTMDESPHFDNPDQFDPGRLRLADIDGTGTTDIIYLRSGGVDLYFNQSGNGWSRSHTLSVFPRVDDLVSIAPVDLLGNGTTCLVWSSPLPRDASARMRYVSLMGGQKPHLLVRSVNNLGAETTVTYAPSTKFYLQDRYAGTPWITRLPFPVHVVERIETRDHISGNRFVTRYSYHHGYFDGQEREFRGFGMVEQVDTEELAALTPEGGLLQATNDDAASHVPPLLTRTWFHTGVYLGRDAISRVFAGAGTGEGEYYREPELRGDEHDDAAEALLLPDTILPEGLSADEAREAARALKGAMLRQEVYALDGSDREEHPYTVAEQNFTIKVVQPRGTNRYGVFFTHARETLTYHYERRPDDPRVAHGLTLEVDDYGSVLKEAAVAYGRREPSGDPGLTSADSDKQAGLLVTYTENDVTNAVSDDDHHRTPLPSESRTYELTGVEPADAARFSHDEWTRDSFALAREAAEIPYQQAASGAARQKRLIERVRTLYRKNDLTALAAPGGLESLALPGRAYQLALTPTLIAAVFRRTRAGGTVEQLVPDPSAVLEGGGADQGGYVLIDGAWWLPSAAVYFDPDADAADAARTAAGELDEARRHFFQPRKIVDPFGNSTVVSYDEHDLLLAATRDALQNTVTASNDYRTLQPGLITDPNGNRSTVAFDALGVVVATAVMGKDGESVGDLLEGFDPDPPLATSQAFAADPRAEASALLGEATTRIVYDLDRFRRSGQPAFAASLARETHAHDLTDADTKIRISFSYSDGFGREIQRKIPAEDGEAPARSADVPLPDGDVSPGGLERDASGGLVWSHASPRWVGTGRTVFNNKGKPVRRYEPFFSSTHLYEPEQDMTDTGVSPILFYDPLSRVVATLRPNHSYEKVVFDAWKQITYDANDTAAPSGTQTGDPRTDPDVGSLLSRYFAGQPATWQTWYGERISRPDGDAERDAAEKTAAHADTPTTAHLDALGRPFLTLADNGPDPAHTGQRLLFATRVELDIEGNQRAVVDSLDRVVMRYDYDLLGTRIHGTSMEAGDRWMINDAAGNPIRTWDSRNHGLRAAYDELRRPTDLHLQDGDKPEVLVGRTLYGESHAVPENRNLRGRVVESCDQAGVMTTNEYDFKGNLLSTQRRLAQEYKAALDWSADVPLETETFSSRTRYDALNRPIQLIAPRTDRAGSGVNVIQPTYNEANLLERLDVWLGRDAEPDAAIDREADAPDMQAVTGIAYDAKGQRTRIEYGNKVATTYAYDPLTFRLVSLLTQRDRAEFPDDCPDPAPADWPGCDVQNLYYTYDPAGNITHIRDDAQQTIYFRNRRVEPSSDYTYDALYRLIEATGREHLGQAGGAPIPHTHDDAGRVGLPHPGDGNAMGTYLERFVYDAVGNILSMQHAGSDPAHAGWTRTYAYEEPSLLETGAVSNRLSSTTVSNGGIVTEPYEHDEHGNMTRMAHLPLMRWDYRDQLQATARTVMGDGGTPETTWYVYDAAGQRVRKVTDGQASAGQAAARRHERFYLGGLEVYREYAADGSTLTLERETLQVADAAHRVALVETRTQGNDGSSTQLIRYQFGNHLGSTTLELNDLADVVSYEEYSPYGSTTHQGMRQAEAPKQYRYAGMERDEEAGLHYHGARYYASWLGRWCSTDPVGIRDHINVYVSVRNNPIVRRDPSGTESTRVDEVMVVESRREGFWETGVGKALAGVGGILAGVAVGSAVAFGVGMIIGAGVLSTPALVVIAAAALATFAIDIAANWDEYKALASRLASGEATAGEYFGAGFSASTVFNPAAGRATTAGRATVRAVKEVGEDAAMEVTAGVASFAREAGEVLPSLSADELTAKLSARVFAEAEAVAASRPIEKGKVAAGPQEPTAIAGVTDAWTGDVSVAVNDMTRSAPPKDLHPLLQSLLNNYLEIGSAGAANHGPPGLHAEVQALSQRMRAVEAVLRRELTEADLRHFYLQTRRTTGVPAAVQQVPAPGASPVATEVMPRCPNCWWLTPDVEYVGPP